jgi:hypothetical protein
VSPEFSSPRRRDQTRLRVAVLSLVLVAGAVGAAQWWTGRQASAPDFAYLHGALPSPPAGQDEVVFQLSGPGGQLKLTLAQLRALPAVQYAAVQPQLRRNIVYTGVPLRDLAALVGLSGQNLRVGSDDQFAATLNARDYQRYPLMLAYAENGQPISVADKGPLEVVFPNVQYPKLFKQTGYGSQWVWYASTLTAAP